MSTVPYVYSIYYFDYHSITIGYIFISLAMFMGSLCSYPTDTKHLYNIYTASAQRLSTLVQHCINVIQMFCVCWVFHHSHLYSLETGYCWP